ncbi:MAG: hypothetical protein AAGA57_04030 [Planctomycetota bacterium]
MHEPHITFRGVDAFSSGPASLQPPSAEARLAVHEPLAGAGGSAAPRGAKPRNLLQTGELRADSRPELESIHDAVAALVDGQAGPLTDHLADRTYPTAVIESFSPQPAQRIGPRWARRYQIRYLDLSP